MEEFWYIPFFLSFFLLVQFNGSLEPTLFKKNIFTYGRVLVHLFYFISTTIKVIWWCLSPTLRLKRHLDTKTVCKYIYIYLLQWILLGNKSRISLI